MDSQNKQGRLEIHTTSGKVICTEWMAARTAEKILDEILEFLTTTSGRGNSAVRLPAANDGVLVIFYSQVECLELVFQEEA